MKAGERVWVNGREGRLLCNVIGTNYQKWEVYWPDGSVTVHQIEDLEWQPSSQSS